jgi:hypothetical protein
MPIVHRSFTYKGRIKVSREDLKLARIGRKSCTIRLGRVNVEDDVIYLSDGNEKLKVKIANVDSSRVYSQLTDEDAVSDGLESKEQLDRDLSRFYGKIDPMQPITIIHFMVLEH